MSEIAAKEAADTTELPDAGLETSAADEAILDFDPSSGGVTARDLGGIALLPETAADDGFGALEAPAATAPETPDPTVVDDSALFGEAASTDDPSILVRTEHDGADQHQVHPDDRAHASTPEGGAGFEERDPGTDSLRTSEEVADGGDRLVEIADADASDFRAHAAGAAQQRAADDHDSNLSEASAVGVGPIPDHPHSTLTGAVGSGPEDIGESDIVGYADGDQAADAPVMPENKLPETIRAMRPGDVLEASSHVMPNERPDISDIRRTYGLYTMLDNTTLEAVPSVPLPDGFVFAAADSVSATELTELDNSVGIYGHEHPIKAVSDALDRRRLDIQTVGIGVRSENDMSLVGYGALCILGSQGLLCDLVVHPEYQHNGIGRAVTQECLVQAERLGIQELRVKLEPTNTLRSYYVAHGFREANRAGNVLVRGRGALQSLLHHRKSSSSNLYYGL